jgi:uncharacterized protein (DUF1697 family)
MPAIVCMLRGVNVGGNNIISMEALRSVCTSIKLRNAVTYVQSGNIVFEADSSNLVKLASEIETAIERRAGFRPAVYCALRRKCATWWRGTRSPDESASSQVSSWFFFSRAIPRRRL